MYQTYKCIVEGIKPPSNNVLKIKHIIEAQNEKNALNIADSRSRLDGLKVSTISFSKIEKVIPTNDDIAEFEKLLSSLNIRNHTADNVIRYLKNNDVESARREYYHDGDKFYDHALLKIGMNDLLGCRAHNNRNCEHWLCNGIYKVR